MAEILPQRRLAACWPPLLLPLLLLSVARAQLVNRAPHFVPQTGDMAQFSLPEDTPVGTPVYQLKGVDPERGALRYSISGQWFAVDARSGVVTLARALDREHAPALELIISITDEGIAGTEPNTVSLRRVVPVRDVNDNAPRFRSRPYRAAASEATPLGAEIQVTPNIIVTDDDEGVNADIRVTCAAADEEGDADACDTFNVLTEKRSDNEYQVRLFLSKRLDFESRSAFVVRLWAADASAAPLRAAAAVAVAVLDEQDQPPAFLNAPYSATLPENTPPNTSIMEIIAKDGDSANPRPVLLTIEGDTENYFKLLPERAIGRATLVASDIRVDRESETVMQNGGVYSFFIKATELINNEVPSDFTVTPVTIIVTDVDDHVPVFNKDNFDISIPENIENGSPIPGLSVYVKDNDIGQNSRYDLSLRDVFNSEGVFFISTEHGEGRTPISIKVKDSSKLDYDVDNDEKRIFSFDIVSSSNGIELSSARVNIKLYDMNDNAPIFDEASYKFNVLENATIGTKIGDVHATDKDFGIFGEIEYTLTGFGSNFFKTDRSKGGLYVRQQLDYEKQKSYSLTLLAKDGGGKGTTTSIYVDVLDVNDNSPIFESSDYSRTIRDGATSFEPQFVIRATDADGKSQGNGRIRYTLESDNSITHKGNVFTINEDTGEISILDKVETMDTPRGQYELVVRATDYGTPPLYNETKVYIRVGVPGNQRPTFKGNYHHYKYTVNQRNPESNDEYTFDLNPMNYKASVREDATPGQNVTRVLANDPDGLDDLLTYHIVTGSKDNFVINEKTGLITVSHDANLDRDVNTDKYEIIVSAVDSGMPVPETATTTVFVTIQDVNDKPPKFNMTESTTYISEKTKIGELVTRIIAYDTDVNAKLKYSINDTIKAFSKAGVQLKPNAPYDYRHMFRIDEDTGELFVNATLDYSQVSIVILTIKVVDINAELNKDKQFGYIEHTIYIQPYADKNPQFVNPGWSAANPVIYHKIKEEQPIGSTVLVLMAEDPVSGHTVSNFKVINSETGLLQVDPLSGQVVLTKHLDYEELTSPNLTLTVQATSNDGSKHSTAKIIIEVININDNPPIFEKELYKVSVLESIKHPEPIVTVKATDADAVLTEADRQNGFSDVRYSLRGENSDLFIIDNVTGVIMLSANQSVDRERQSVVRVELEAADAPRGAERRRARAALLLDVLDVDDNHPTFDKNEYTAVVPENVPVGISVIKITATDPDEGLGGEVKYELVDEGDANGLFSLDPQSGVLSSRRALAGRGRTAPFRLAAAAADGGGHAARAALLVYVGDVSGNDGVPGFIRPAPGELLSVSENATIGSTVFQVVASDPDDPTQPSGQIYYSIEQNNADAKNFAIDARSGVIRTRQALDRERRARYTLVLRAEDRGAPPQRATRIATVVVSDVDDHKPHFARNIDEAPLLMSVPEEVPVGTVIGQLQAVDEDEGENAAIDYAIIAGNEQNLVRLERFADSSARLVAAARLDREATPRLLLTLRCFKLGTAPRPASAYNRLDPSQIQVLIKILDIDDHLPQFESGNLTVGVRLNVPVHAAVATLRAADRDPAARPLRYSIVNTTFQSPIKSKSIENVTDVFHLNNVTGELKIMKNLIHFADGVFRLVVRANNSEEVDRHSDMTVEVVVVRERDLLRLAAAGTSRARLRALQERLAAALVPHQLRLQLHDALDTNFYDNPGPCFQFRKAGSGEALSPRAMRAAIRALGAEFQQILSSFGVRDVTGCGTQRARHSAAQRALLAVAAALPLAALAALAALCCMHHNAKRRSRSALLLSRAPAPSQLSAGGPGRLYAEPLYST